MGFKASEPLSDQRASKKVDCSVRIKTAHLALQLSYSFSELSLGGLRQLRVEALREALPAALLVFTLRFKRIEDMIEGSQSAGQIKSGLPFQNMSKKKHNFKQNTTSGVHDHVRGGDLNVSLIQTVDA